MPRSAWKTSIVDVWTTRRAPAAAAARTTVSVPRALTWSNTPSSGTHCSGSPIALKTSSQPAAARSTEAGSVTSPRTASMPGGSTAEASPGLRTSARTSSPRSSSARDTACPTLPVTPVTSARMGAHLRSERLAGPMSRFRDPQDPLFRALNSSISFDYRLAPYDLEQSLAHARMLAHSGIIAAEDLEQIEHGLAQVREEIDEDRFVVAEDDEDIHMAIERRLTELIGPAGGKLHTARSRNDQVATDVAMLVRAHALDAQALLRELMTTLVELAERHLDWPLPGYTHLQRAQPVYLSHHLLAYFWKLRRDVQRFKYCMTATDDLPLGAGALAGVNFDTSRMFVAQELGFGGIAENSLDAVSNRDFVLDYLSAAATCAGHLSQLGGEIVLWSTSEFGFCRVSDSFASGSSLMPQKKNPDAAELLRAKAPRRGRAT